MDGYFDPGAEPFRMVALQELGATSLDGMRDRYNQQEFSYALTPFLMDWVLRQGMGRVLFIKQESLVTGDLTPVADLLRNSRKTDTAAAGWVREFLDGWGPRPAFALLLPARRLNRGFSTAARRRVIKRYQNLRKNSLELSLIWIRNLKLRARSMLPE